MIDLHIHSTYSDGSASVAEILKMAEELGLHVISITDHEKCGAHEELENTEVRKLFSGRIIPGIELKTQYKGGIIDILGYNINWRKMKKFLNECYGGVTRDVIQEGQLRDFYELGEKYGLALRPMDEVKWDKQREWACIVFYNELKSHEENRNKVPEDLWDSLTVFRKKYYHRRDSMFGIDRARYYPTLDKIANVIHESDGLVFVAHIHEYTWLDNPMDELKEIIKKFDVDGAECYHSIFTDEQIKELIHFCTTNNLLMSGGSDYHGKNKPDISLAVGKGNLAIPDDTIANWPC